MDPRLEVSEILLGHLRVLKVKLKSFYATPKQRRVMGIFETFIYRIRARLKNHSRAVRKNVKGKDGGEGTSRK